MPDLNLDPDYFQHPKTRRLVGLLGNGSDVLPLRLWAYCAKYHAKDGRLAGYSAQEIESCVGWWGEPGRLVETLASDKCRFLHKDAEGYRVHDWQEHQGHIEPLRQRAQNAAKARWDKEREKARDASSNANGNARGNAPIPSVPDQTKDPPTPHGGGEVGEVPKTAKGVEIPPPLRTPEFLAAWAEWESHLRKKRVKTTDIADSRQLAECVGWGPDAAVRCIRFSISKNYQGLFAPREGSNGETTRQRAERLAAEA